MQHVPQPLINAPVFSGLLSFHARQIRVRLSESIRKYLNQPTLAGRLDMDIDQQPKQDQQQAPTAKAYALPWVRKDVQLLWNLPSVIYRALPSVWDHASLLALPGALQDIRVQLPLLAPD